MFGWDFDSWGPPDFYLIRTGTEVDGHLRGAFQRRVELLDGQGMRGFEYSIAGERWIRFGRVVEEHGGTVILPKSPIPGIGWVVKLRDTEDNEVAAVEKSPGGQMSARGKMAMVTLGGLLMLSAACASPDPGSASGVDTATEVASFLDEYLTAIDTRDFDVIRRAYVDDGRLVWIEDGDVRYRSADAILASLGAFPAGSAIRTELSDLVVVPLGGAGAHAWATFSTTVGSGPGSFSFGGAISFVLEREDGSWKLVGGHTSSPTGR